MKKTYGILIGLSLLAGLGFFSAGCGRIADKDQIVIAKIGEKSITRGDLYQLIYEMGDTERPKIRNKNDMLRILNNYIDEQIKVPLGKKLAQEKKIEVDREMARAQFFAESGDDQEFYKAAWEMEIPKDGGITPLMAVYELTPSSMQSMKDYIEEETDVIVERLQGERALAYLAAQDLKGGKIPVAQEDIEREYRIRKDTLIKQEWLKFNAMYFPTQMEGAAAKAAKIRERIDAGEDFDKVSKEVYDNEPRALLQSEIERNPASTSFQGFWLRASGAKVNDIIGPVFMPAFNQVAQKSDGESVPVQVPESYMVLKVIEHRPERILSLEESKLMLVMPLIVSAKMKELWEEQGVEVYREKLPDPAQFMEEYGKIGI